MKGGLWGILKNIFFEPWDQGLFKNISLMDGQFFLFQPFLQQAVYYFHVLVLYTTKYLS